MQFLLYQNVQKTTKRNVAPQKRNINKANEKIKKLKNYK